MTKFNLKNRDFEAFQVPKMGEEISSEMSLFLDSFSTHRCTDGGMYINNENKYHDAGPDDWIIKLDENNFLVLSVHEFNIIFESKD